MLMDSGSQPAPIVTNQPKTPNPSDGPPTENTRSQLAKIGGRVKDSVKDAVNYFAKQPNETIPLGIPVDVPSSYRHESPFNLGNSVILQSVTGDVIHGTVRWVGPIRVSQEGRPQRGPPIPVVGVETDKKVNPEKDFSGLCVGVIGSHGQDLFKVAPNHSRVFLPEQLVSHEDEFTKQRETEDATKHEQELAKQYGLSVDEYHSQKELLDQSSNAARDIKNDNKEPHDPHHHALPHDPTIVNESNEEGKILGAGGGKESARERREKRQLEGTLHAVNTGKVSDRKSKEQQTISDKLEREKERKEKKNERELSHDYQGESGLFSQALPDLSQFSIGSIVSVARQRGPPLYGVIRWIGTLHDFPGMTAGVELENTLNGCTDGTWQGHRFFHCLPKRGFFCPLKSLEVDDRYLDDGQAPPNTREDIANPLDKTPRIEDKDMTPAPAGEYIGDGRGIQGHHNSCYLDSTVFGLFALTDSFDELLLSEPQEEVGRRVKYLLLKGIVNPLRKYGLARHESVMDLRNSLEQFGQMKGANTDEKDPEEFLYLLFKHILHIEPFLSIKRPFGIEKEYFVQLFFELNPKGTEIPRTEKLIAQMFHEQNISFTQVPSKLLLQMPRFGKNFKMYNKIIPSLTLDVTPLLDPSTLSSTAGDVIPISRMHLLSVICIETSHYVCYTRLGDQWLFHDSMANRLYDMYNIPKVVDVSHDLYEWVYSGENLHRLMNAPSKEIPEYVRRFTQDIYMCIYINPDHGHELSPSLSRQSSTAQSTSIEPYDDKSEGPIVQTKENQSDSLSCEVVLTEETAHEMLQERAQFSSTNINSSFTFDDIITTLQKLHDEKKWFESNFDHLMKNYTQQLESNKKLKQQHNKLQQSHGLVLKALRAKEEENHAFKELHASFLATSEKQYCQLQQSIVEKEKELQTLLKSHKALTVEHRKRKEEFHKLHELHDQLEATYKEKEEQFCQSQKNNKVLKGWIKAVQNELKTKNDQAIALQEQLAVIEGSWKVSFKEVSLTTVELGRGAWAEVTVGVYRGQRVAVKRFHKTVINQPNNEYYVGILLREINTMAQLRHPNLLQFIGAVFDHPSGNPLIITEVMDTSLRKAYEGKALTPAQQPVILSIMRDVAVGLNYLHCLPDPIIHRDVNSANVLLESKGPGKWKTKISDFGSAKMARSAITKAPGAEVYSAPECYQAVMDINGKKQTPKVDTYSYGILLCEVVSCHFPERERFHKILEEIHRHSTSLHRLIVWCVEKEPDNRPSMGQIFKTLDHTV